jgi:hypothetical protein
LGPALLAPAAPRDPRDAIPLRIRAAPATPRVAYVTDFCSVDFPFWITEDRQEIVWPLSPINWRVAAPSIYVLTKTIGWSTSGTENAIEGIWFTN